MFHFNKVSLTDSNIPAWVLKFKGQTHYVKHVTANAPWSTKETPDNTATKGAIKFKDVDVIIDDDECAEIVNNKEN